MLKKACVSDIQFYENVLYKIQDTVLKNLLSYSFYLTGGTALSRFYYNHRYSEDLDFFYDGFTYPKENFSIEYREILYRLEPLFDKVEVTLDSEFYKRIFCHTKDISLKVEFIYENFRTLGEKKIFKDFSVDSKENICTNKVTAITDRKTVKDFFDLYFLLKDIKLEDILRWSEYKQVPFDYEGIILAVGDILNNISLIEGEVLTKTPLPEKTFKKFIIDLTKEIIEYAKRR